MRRTRSAIFLSTSGRLRLRPIWARGVDDLEGGPSISVDIPRTHPCRGRNPFQTAPLARSTSDGEQGSDR